MSYQFEKQTGLQNPDHQIRDALSEQIAYQDALLVVSRAVQQMTRPEHLEAVVDVCREQLRALGISFIALAVHRLISPDTFEFESYEVMPSGKLNRLVREVPNIFRMWKKQKTLYRENLLENMGGLTPEVLGEMSSRYGVEVKCILDIPHARGTLALLSDHVSAFSPAAGMDGYVANPLRSQSFFDIVENAPVATPGALNWAKSLQRVDGDATILHTLALFFAHQTRVAAAVLEEMGENGIWENVDDHWENLKGEVDRLMVELGNGVLGDRLQEHERKKDGI